MINLLTMQANTHSPASDSTILDHEIERLKRELSALGGEAERVIVDAVEALRRQDVGRAREIIDQDYEINAQAMDIEAGCLNLLAAQQPRPRDIRTITAMIGIAAELERICDHAKGLAKITLLIGDEKLLKPLIDIPRMATKGQGMLHRAMVAFARGDLKLARAIPAEDDEVDALYNQVFRELITYCIKKPALIDQTNLLLWAAHNLERTADRVTNICERVVYMITGTVETLDESAT